MKKKNRNPSARGIFIFVIRAIVALAVLIFILASYEVNNVLHPPRINPQGKTLRKYHIPYQYVDLITEDGVRLSAWYTPPKNGAVILLAHGHGEKRPEWGYALL